MRLVAVLALVLALAAPAAAAAERPNPAELVCPTCKTTLDQSNAPVALRMKAYIRSRIAAGASAAEIKSELVDQFGPAVLATPRKEGFDLLAWALPLAVLGVGVLVVGALAWAWSRRREPVPAAPGLDAELDPELERRVDDELAHYDE